MPNKVSRDKKGVGIASDTGIKVRKVTKQKEIQEDAYTPVVEEGVSLDEWVAKHEQAIYELKQYIAQLGTKPLLESGNSISILEGGKIGINTASTSHTLNVVGGANITGETYLGNNLFINETNVGIGASPQNVDPSSTLTINSTGGNIVFIL